MMYKLKGWMDKGGNSDAEIKGWIRESIMMWK